MQRQIALYIKGQSIDLFEGESISLNSSVQNIAELDKTFSDFTQSFTVPASKNNNKVFKHWYNFDLNNGFDARIRHDAHIEIDLLPFKSGKLELQGCMKQDGEITSYRVVFFGLVTTLKDAFGQLRLSDLDYSHVNFPYGESEVRTAVQDHTNQPIKFPLISSKRLWQYGNSGADDISTIGGGIDYKELFPAVQDLQIMQAIQNSTGLTFTGTFFDDPVFLSSYTLFKNENDYSFSTKSTQLQFSVGTENIPTEDSVSRIYLQWAEDEANEDIFNVRLQIRVQIFTDTPGVEYILEVYKNGEFFSSIQNNGTAVKFP